MLARSFSRSITHLLSGSVSHSLSRLQTYSLACSLTYLLARSLTFLLALPTHALALSLACSSTYRLARSLNFPITDLSTCSCPPTFTCICLLARSLTHLLMSLLLARSPRALARSFIHFILYIPARLLAVFGRISVLLGFILQHMLLISTLSRLHCARLKLLD